VADLDGKIPRIGFNDYDAIIAPGDYCSGEIKKYSFMQVKYAIKGKKVPNLEEIIGLKRYKKIANKMFF